MSSEKMGVCVAHSAVPNSIATNSLGSFVAFPLAMLAMCMYGHCHSCLWNQNEIHCTPWPGACSWSMVLSTTPSLYATNMWQSTLALSTLNLLPASSSSPAAAGFLGCHHFPSWVYFVSDLCDLGIQLLPAGGTTIAQEGSHTWTGLRIVSLFC